MARSDRAAFLGVLTEAERELQRLMAEIAHDVGDLVLRAAGPDGMVPVERIAELQKAAGQVVDAAFLGAGREPFNERNEPMAAYPRILAKGQLAMIDLALERQARLLEQHLPGDLLTALASRKVQR